MFVSMDVIPDSGFVCPETVMKNISLVKKYIAYKITHVISKKLLKENYTYRALLFELMLKIPLESEVGRMQLLHR